MSLELSPKVEKPIKVKAKLSSKKTKSLKQAVNLFHPTLKNKYIQDFNACHTTQESKHIVRNVKFSGTNESIIRQIVNLITWSNFEFPWRRIHDDPSKVKEEVKSSSGIKSKYFRGFDFSILDIQEDKKIQILLECKDLSLSNDKLISNYINDRSIDSRYRYIDYNNGIKKEDIKILYFKGYRLLYHIIDNSEIPKILFKGE